MDTIKKKKDFLPQKDKDDLSFKKIDLKFNKSGRIEITFLKSDGTKEELEIDHPKEKLLKLVHQLGIVLLNAKSEENKESFATLPNDNSGGFNYICKLLTFNSYIKEPVVKIIADKIQNMSPTELREFCTESEGVIQRNRKGYFQ